MDEDNKDPKRPETWVTVRDVCGSCIAWRVSEARIDDRVATGACKLRPELGRVPADLKKCSRYMRRGQDLKSAIQAVERSASASRPRAKKVSVMRVTSDGSRHETRPTLAQRDVDAPTAPGPEPEERTHGRIAHPPIAVTSYPVRPIERAPGPKDVDLGEGAGREVVRWALIELVRTELGRSERSLHSRFKKGGKVEAHSREGPERDVTSERFFAWIDRVRTTLERLDGTLVDHAGSLGGDLADLRAQVGRMQGSFTTFNFLFENREDYFSSKE